VCVSDHVTKFHGDRPRDISLFGTTVPGVLIIINEAKLYLMISYYSTLC